MFYVLTRNNWTTLKLFKIVFTSYFSTSWKIQIEENNLNIVNIKKRKYLHNHGFGWYLKNILKRFYVVSKFWFHKVLVDLQTFEYVNTIFHIFQKYIVEESFTRFEPEDLEYSIDTSRESLTFLCVIYKKRHIFNLYKIKSV